MSGDKLYRSYSQYTTHSVGKKNKSFVFREYLKRKAIDKERQRDRFSAHFFCCFHHLVPPYLLATVTVVESTTMVHASTCALYY